MHSNKIFLILEENTREHKLYLPSGTTWKDTWTNERYIGGQWITINAPLDIIPFFLKGEATLPISEWNFKDQ